jgi:hypothetical protein
MKKIFIKLFLLAIVSGGCTDQSPENIFSQVVLNTNLFFGFAGNADFRQLESPSEKLVPGTTVKTEPMKRVEIMQDKIEALSRSYDKVRKLSTNGDAKEMAESSVALYEYVLPVYKNEYMQLAKLYDDGATADLVQQLWTLIQTKYQNGFVILKDKLTAAEKEYATKNTINVKWDVKTAP